MPVPWEPSQTIYVWVDALLNYRTAQEYGLGRDVTSEFWPTSLHLMAKDILRLHGDHLAGDAAGGRLRAAAAACSCTATSPPAARR